jgi:hypothetical protein
MPSLDGFRSDSQDLDREERGVPAIDVRIEQQALDLLQRGLRGVQEADRGRRGPPDLRDRIRKVLLDVRDRLGPLGEPERRDGQLADVLILLGGGALDDRVVPAVDLDFQPVRQLSLRAPQFPPAVEGAGIFRPAQVKPGVEIGRSDLRFIGRRGAGGKQAQGGQGGETEFHSHSLTIRPPISWGA